MPTWNSLQVKSLVGVFTAIAILLAITSAGFGQAPANVAVDGSNIPVVVTWSAVGGASGYNVYRSTESGAGYVRLNASPVAGTSYSDSSASQNTTYYYVVTALVSGGESGYSSQASTVTPIILAPTADTYVDLWEPTNNHGTSTTLEAYCLFDQDESFLKFNLSGVPSNIGSPVLCLYGGNTSSNISVDSLHGVSDTTWTQAGITWSNMPAMGSALSSVTVTTAQQYYGWDATSWVQAQLSAGASAMSLGLAQDVNYSNVAAPDVFNSSLASSNTPYLIIRPLPAPVDLQAVSASALAGIPM